MLTVCVLTGVALPGGAALPLPTAPAPAMPSIPSGSEPSNAANPGIEPGISIGPASLGMQADQLRAALGGSIPGRPGELVFPRWRITAMMSAGSATQLTTTNPTLRTPTGAGVGTAEAQAVPLVGDFNTAMTRTQIGAITSVLFPFQGVGFLFQNSRATAVYVVQRIPLVPSVTAPRAGEPGTPSGTAAAATPETGAPAPSAAPSGKATLDVRGLAETINGAGVLQVTGQVANVGVGPSGAVALVVTFTRQSGAQIQQQVGVPGPVAPGATAPFAVGAAIGLDLITRYAIVGNADSGIAEVGRAIPFSEYSAFAIRQVQVNVALGAPVGTGNGVPAIVTITSTGAIPAVWVRDVTVQIPFSNGGSTTVHLTPGQSPTVVVPSVPGVGVNNGQCLGLRRSSPSRWARASAAAGDARRRRTGDRGPHGVS